VSDLLAKRQTFSKNNVRQDYGRIDTGGDMNKPTILGFLLLASIAYGASCTESFTAPTSSTPLASTPAPTPTPPTPFVPTPTPSITSLSQTTAIAGSDDITISINGAAFQPRRNGNITCVVWVSDAEAERNPHPEHMLSPRFVSDTELTVEIPAALLQTPMSARIALGEYEAHGFDDGIRQVTNWIPFTVVKSPQ
jgi:hypothetical protein